MFVSSFFGRYLITTLSWTVTNVWFRSAGIKYRVIWLRSYIKPITPTPECKLILDPLLSLTFPSSSSSTSPSYRHSLIHHRAIARSMHSLHRLRSLHAAPLPSRRRRRATDVPPLPQRRPRYSRSAAGDAANQATQILIAVIFSCSIACLLCVPFPLPAWTKQNEQKSHDSPNTV